MIKPATVDFDYTHSEKLCQGQYDQISTLDRVGKKLEAPKFVRKQVGRSGERR